jgi:hypothetical protein
MAAMGHGPPLLVQSGDLRRGARQWASETRIDGVLLEAQHDVAVEEVAWEHGVLEPVDRLAVALAVGVVHRGEQVGRPRQLELDDGQREAG